MKEQDIKNSFNKIEPSEQQIERMYKNILAQRGKGTAGSRFYLKRAVPALAAALLLVVGLFTYKFAFGGAPADFATTENTTQGGKAVTDDLNAKDSTGREIAVITDEYIRFEGRHYVLLYDEKRKEFGFPESVSQNDIGEKITTLTENVDKSPIGLDVYEYLPAAGESVVALKKGEQYKLYMFISFDSYNNNKDEDAIEYLRLYGINSAQDISKVQFIGIDEMAKIRGEVNVIGEIKDAQSISKFYDYYSALKDSSDKYFEALGVHSRENNASLDIASTLPDYIPPEQGGNAADLPVREAPAQSVNPDEPVTDTPAQFAYPDEPATDTPAYDYGEEIIASPQTTPGSPGQAADKLGDSVIIRIYNNSGVYIETYYYPNIGFISRYEVNDDFAQFLQQYIK